MSVATAEHETISGTVRPSIWETEADELFNDDLGRWEMTITSATSAVLRTSGWAWSTHLFEIWDECRALGWAIDPDVDLRVEGDEHVHAMTRV